MCNEQHCCQPPPRTSRSPWRRGLAAREKHKHRENKQLAAAAGGTRRAACTRTKESQKFAACSPRKHQDRAAAPCGLVVCPSPRPHELSSVHGLLCARAHAKQRNSMHNQLANVQAKDANPSTACKSTYPPLTIRNRTNTHRCSSSSNPNAHRTEPSHAHNVIRDELTIDRRRMPFAAQSRRHVHRQTRSLLTLASRQTQIARRACFSRAEESRPGDKAAAASQAIDL